MSSDDAHAREGPTVVPLHEYESLIIETQNGMHVRIVHTAAGELEIERLDGGTLSVCALTHNVVLVLTLPVSRRQHEGAHGDV